MEPKIPPALSLALNFLRTRQGWTQKGLAEATGIPASLISDYERGRKVLSRERLDLIVVVLGLTPKAVEWALDFLQKTGQGYQEAGSPSLQSSIEEIATKSGRLMSGFTSSLLKMLTSEASALEARQEALALWAQLKRLPVTQRRAKIEKDLTFRRWALCELLCEESVQAAGDSADRVLELADLALRVAESTPGEETWRQRLQGYAWAHVGNARRVRSDLPGAEKAFERSQALWAGGGKGDSGLLNEARVFGLQASLLRGQRKFAEALAVLNHALTLDKGRETKYLLLCQAKLFEDAEDFRGAVTALRNAAPLIESGKETRFLFLLKLNLAVNLCSLGEYVEAQELLATIGKLAITLGNNLDKLRAHWIKGRILAGLGKKNEAIGAFFSVREGFTALGIAYDAALVSLEMAVIYLEGKRTTEVKRLAQQMGSVFQLQGVHRETLAALKIFRDAADREAVSLDLAHSLISYFRRSENDPHLRFGWDV